MDYIVAVFLSALSMGYGLSWALYNEGPQFLPNSLEVEVPVSHLKSTSVFYMTQCGGVWLEFVITSCDYDPFWHADIDFYSPNSPNPTFDQQQNGNLDPQSRSPSQQQQQQQQQQLLKATLVDQLHRKVVVVSPDNSREGVYKLRLSGFRRNTTVRIFTSESDQSNYRSVFYPTSNNSGEVWAELGQSNHLKNMWLSWPRMPRPYEDMGEHLTCLTVVSYTAFDRCSSCVYSAMQDSGLSGSGVMYGQCMKPLFRKCATNYNYEPYLPEELRYENEKTIGLISKMHPVTGFTTPYFSQVVPRGEYKERASPFMLRYLSLRPKEEIRMDLEEVIQMNWSRIYLLVQPCYTPVRVKVGSAKRVVKDSLEVFQVSSVPSPYSSSYSTVKLRNGHKQIIAMRYFFTDDVSSHSPLSFTSEIRVSLETTKNDCASPTLTLYNSEPETHYCIIATEMRHASDQLSDYETSKCMNPRRDPSGFERRKWEVCHITPSLSYFALDPLRQSKLGLDTFPTRTDLAVEIFARPANNFYALEVWSKVGDIFQAQIESC